MCVKITNDIFIKNAIVKHGNKYTYEKCNYIKAKTKIIITCPTHGDFLMTPNNFLNGANCQVCAKEQKTPKDNCSSLIEDFLKKYISDVSF